MTEPVNKGGRPRKEINYDLLGRLCGVMCTGDECASILGMSYDALNEGLKRDGHGGFTEYFKIASSSGKASLRRAQFKAAMGGNSALLIWLGKQYLGQREPDNVSKDDDVADLLRKALVRKDKGPEA